MRIHIASDIHAEMAPYAPTDVAADVVVLAGDIDKGERAVRRALEWYPTTPVILVAGNHEFYGGAHPRTIEKMKTLAEGTNVVVLERDEKVIDGTRFLGATLWTDFSVFGEPIPFYMEQARAAMTDFKKIRVSPRYSRFSPEVMLKLHRQARAWLAARLDEPFAGSTVVVTHHAPSVKSCDPRHLDDPVSAAYIVDAENLMGADRVKLWLRGHTHHCVDYEIGGTRVVSNQRGYPGAAVAGFDPCLVVDTE